MHDTCDGLRELWASSYACLELGNATAAYIILTWLSEKRLTLASVASCAGHSKVVVCMGHETKLSEDPADP